ncbi:MAG: hypothetical protein IJH75_00070 [Mogibacterium sp.]|nr:hypothetical protein [Mogibacterium sp.]
MKFGSDEFFEYLGLGLCADPWPEDLTDTVVRVLYRDLEYYRSEGSRYRDYLDDADEVIDNVVIRVLTHLPDIYQKCCSRSAGERNGYLLRMVENEFKSLIRRKKRSPEQPVGFSREEEPASEDEALSGMEYRKGAAPDFRFDEALFSDEADRRLLFRVTEKICRLKTDQPEILLAFLMNRFIAEFELSRRNGSPEMVQAYFKDKTLFEARDMIVEIYRRMLSPAEIPGSVFKGLDEKLGMPAGSGLVGDRLFDLREKQIKDGTTWINRKIGKKEAFKEDEKR